ncbi:MAG: ATP-binding protein [Anaerolineales bacterium]|nr:MAG: ATP-binding protein [Anaerolineales bacterium]
MIKRSSLLSRIKIALGRSRVVALIGPRQSGKTTLARQFVNPASVNYFDLEDPVSLARLEQPMTALQDLRDLVVIDEIQRRPDLFPILRVLADREDLPARFLILGSASPELIRSSSESLAGRMETISISGFSLAEVGVNAMQEHWLRGGFPLSFLAENDSDSFAWRKNFAQTFLERDLPRWGVQIPAGNLLRFWTMISHYHGQIWNAAEPARSMGVSEPTIRRHLDLLQDVFMMRILQPWHTNLKKRQVKSPKIYFRDSGLLHALLGIRTHHDLQTHPKSGASWEGYVIEEAIKSIEPDEVYFWATHNGAEIDLLLFKNGKRFGLECKRVDAPRLTPSMQIAIEDLQLNHLAVIYPGERSYPLAEKATVVPLSSLETESASEIFG